jgi:hypothetical protein
MPPVKLSDLQRDIISSVSNDGGLTNPYHRNNIDPKYWGPPGWTFIDSIIDGMPEHADILQVQRMHSFIMSLGTLLPCQKCRDNHRNFIARYPPDRYLQGKSSMKSWFNKYKQQK